MTIRKLSAAGTICAAAVLVPMAANAACTLGNAAGKWQIYAFTVAPGSGTTETGVWARCLVQISAAGAIANTTCTSPSGLTGPLTNGHVTLANGPNCTYSASFKTFGTTYLVSHATLSGDRQTVFGVGKVVGRPFTLQMLKIVP